jgi:hypothetical protein
MVRDSKKQAHVVLVFYAGSYGRANILEYIIVANAGFTRRVERIIAPASKHKRNTACCRCAKKAAPVEEKRLCIASYGIDQRCAVALDHDGAL